MRTLNCYVIDDQQFAINIIRKLIEDTTGLKFIGAETDPVRAKDLILSGAIKPDICFVDIEMENMNGLDLAQAIKNETSIIFTTGHEKYALPAYDFGPVDFLKKPFSRERFLVAIGRARKVFPEEHAAIKTYFTIQANGKGNLIKLNFEDVFYLEAQVNYVVLHTRHGQYKTLSTLKEMETKLPEGSFLRIHRSFIINRKQFKQLSGGMVTLENGDELILGDSYRNLFLKEVKKDSL